MKLRYLIGNKLMWFNLLLFCCTCSWQLENTSKYLAKVEVSASIEKSATVKDPVTIKYYHIKYSHHQRLSQARSKAQCPIVRQNASFEDTGAQINQYRTGGPL